MKTKARILPTAIVVALGVAIGAVFMRTGGKGTSPAAVTLAPTPESAPAAVIPVAKISNGASVPKVSQPESVTTRTTVNSGGGTTKTAVLVPAQIPGQTVAIEDGKTIDFSSGAAVVKKSDAADQAALEAGLREIEEATKDMTISPSAK